MNYQEIENRLIPLRDYEESCREIYLANPEAFRHVVWNWEEFKERFRSTDKSGCTLGETAPVFMGNLLTEQDCFPDENMECSIILHDRYAPPFYHNLKFIKVVYALRGRCRFFAQGKTRDRETLLEEGDFCVVPPEMNQAVFTWEEDAVTVNIILKRSTFGEAFYSLLLENDSISDFFWQMLYSKGSGRVLVVRSGRDERLRRIVLEMCEEGLPQKKGREAGGNLMMKGYVMLLFGWALKAHQQEMENMGSISVSEAALPVIVRYIRENYTTVTLTSLAKHFGKSEGYLSRYIRRETGKAFRFLLKEFRMKQSAGMIENSSCSIEEVAAAVGYSDISCFYRNFKESFGCTPQQYRSKKNQVSL